MAGQGLSFTIETEIPSSYLGNLMDFIYRKYVLAQERHFTNVSRKVVDGDPSIAFDVLNPIRKHTLKVEIRGSTPIIVTVTPLEETVTDAEIEEVKQDVIIVVELFEEEVRKSTLFFAWREGEEIVPEELHGKEKKPINRMLLETQILLSVVFISLGMFLLLIAGWLAPVILLATQFIVILYSSKFIARTAD